MYKLCQIIFVEVTLKDDSPAEIVQFRIEEQFSLTMIIIVQVIFTHVDLSALLKDLM